MVGKGVKYGTIPINSHLNLAIYSNMAALWLERVQKKKGITLLAGVCCKCVVRVFSQGCLIQRIYLFSLFFRAKDDGCLVLEQIVHI